MNDHLMSIANQQLVTIARTTAYHCDEQHEYMKGAGGTDWLPHKWVVEAMRAAVRIRNTQAEDVVREELHKARAQLAEARALLHTASIRLARWLDQDDDPRKQIIAFLESHAEPSAHATPYPNRLCHIDYNAHPYQCGCLKGDEEAQRRYDEQFAKPGAGPSSPLPPVDGDMLPAISSKVLIHLAREDEWVEHTVVGYYVWENLRPDPGVHRVFVRVRDADGYLNARGLADIRPAVLEHKP
ncbi:hypothetical protein V9385_15715 [Pseudomonas juntendi]|uniref:Uncharacterized protein n=1 Tax=Pseudomonas juntendi TaxID=2666183 RepID=A0A7W2R1U0_9PSED|nr:hypothetical protein [Pseudomonas juntendi]MBA6130993.1 hypothetical protein [Pseudomonas juntendi]MBA6151047.1 hypothetical protein [Pseudomonas juntendi]